MPLSAVTKRLVPLVFALVMGAVAVTLLHQYLAQKRGELERERKKLMANYQAPIDVIVAAKDLPEGTTLDASLVKMAQVPERFVQPYVARSPSDVIGLITMAPVAEGEQVMLNKIRRPEAVPKDATLASLTPKGKRAVTIGVDIMTGVGGFVRPGDMVDILWTIQVPEGGQSQGQQLATITLFQDVPVLAVGEEMAGRAKGGKRTAASEYAVTLALTPQETSFLLFAREQGRVQLSLRSPQESGSVPVAPANITTLMETVMGTSAEHAPKPNRAVEVYKGLKRDVVQLPGE